MQTNIYQSFGRTDNSAEQIIRCNLISTLVTLNWSLVKVFKIEGRDAPDKIRHLSLEHITRVSRRRQINPERRYPQRNSTPLITCPIEGRVLRYSSIHWPASARPTTNASAPHCQGRRNPGPRQSVYFHLSWNQHLLTYEATYTLHTLNNQIVGSEW